MTDLKNNRNLDSALKSNKKLKMLKGDIRDILKNPRYDDKQKLNLIYGVLSNY